MEDVEIEKIKASIKEVVDWVSSLAFSLLEVFPDAEVFYRFLPSFDSLQQFMYEKNDARQRVYFEYPSVNITLRVMRMVAVYQHSETIQIVQFLATEPDRKEIFKESLFDYFTRSMSKVLR